MSEKHIAATYRASWKNQENLKRQVRESQAEIIRLRGALAERDAVIVAMREALRLYAAPHEHVGEEGLPVPVPDFYNELDFGLSAQKALALTPADLAGLRLVSVEHLQEALRFYPPHDHDIKTRLIGDELRAMIGEGDSHA